MAEQVDILQSVLNVLRDSWILPNSNTVLPVFEKITNKNRLDFGTNVSWILAQRPSPEIKPAGIGEANKHNLGKFNLDIRVIGRDREHVFLNTLGEIERIFDNNKVNPFTAIPTTTHVLEYDGVQTDLSNATRNLWRIVIPVQVNRYNISR